MVKNSFVESIENVLFMFEDPVILVDDKAKVMAANNLFKDTFRIKKYGLKKGTSLANAFAPTNKIRKYILDKLQDINVPKELKINGRFYEVKSSNISMNNNAYYFFLFDDTTEQVSVENKLKSFTSDVAHELKTPLAGITAISELIAYSDKLDTKKIKEESQYIYDEAQRLSTLVNNLLEISKPDYKKDQSTKEFINAKEAISHVVNGLKHKFEKNNIEIKLDIESDKIFTNYNDIIQVLTNLIDNAITYANKKVRVKVSLIENYYRIKVEDDGIGMKQEEATRVFDRFYRADQSRNKGSGGFGLGLAIVKDIIDNQNGNIEVRTKKNMGTEFIVLLPKKGDK
ncbi:MAG: sensor histidine kinase [Mycoplasmatales bacterium]